MRISIGTSPGGRLPMKSDRDVDGRLSPAHLHAAVLPLPVLLLLPLLLPAVSCSSPDSRESAGQELAADSPPERQVIRPEDSESSSLYSPVIRSGDVLYLSGVLGFDPEGGGLAEGGIEAETRQTLENLQSRLELAGAGMDDLLKCTVYLANIDDYGSMNEVYQEYFDDQAPPARTAVAVSGLAADAAIEVDCVARAPANE